MLEIRQARERMQRSISSIDSRQPPQAMPSASSFPSQNQPSLGSWDPFLLQILRIVPTEPHIVEPLTGGEFERAFVEKRMPQPSDSEIIHPFLHAELGEQRRPVE